MDEVDMVALDTKIKAASNQELEGWLEQIGRNGETGLSEALRSKINQELESRTRSGVVIHGGDCPMDCPAA